MKPTVAISKEQIFQRIFKECTNILIRCKNVVGITVFTYSVLAAIPVFSQVIISGTETDVANPKAMLEVRSITKGLLIPRMTEAQRLAITFTPPAQGLTVYQTNNRQGYYYNTSSTNSPNWVFLLNSASTDVWQTTGNAGLVDGTHFIGTTTNVPLNFRVNNQKAGRIDPVNRVVTFGRLAGNSLATGQLLLNGRDNVFIGDSAGFSVNTCFGNTFVGSAAGRNTIGNIPGLDSVGIFSIGSLNSFYGVSSGYRNTTGYSNSYFGANAGKGNTTGNENSFFGEGSGFSNTTGSNNAFAGNESGRSNTTGSEIPPN